MARRTHLSQGLHVLGWRNSSQGGQQLAGRSCHRNVGFPLPHFPPRQSAMGGVPKAVVPPEAGACAVDNCRSATIGWGGKTVDKRRPLRMTVRASTEPARPACAPTGGSYRRGNWEGTLVNYPWVAGLGILVEIWGRQLPKCLPEPYPLGHLTQDVWGAALAPRDCLLRVRSWGNPQRGFVLRSQPRGLIPRGAKNSPQGFPRAPPSPIQRCRKRATPRYAARACPRAQLPAYQTRGRRRAPVPAHGGVRRGCVQSRAARGILESRGLRHPGLQAAWVSRLPSQERILAL